MSSSDTSGHLPHSALLLRHADTRSASQLEEELAALGYHFPANLYIVEQSATRVAGMDDGIGPDHTNPSFDPESGVNTPFADRIMITPCSEVTCEN
jgi:hypothetical protein